MAESNEGLFLTQATYLSEGAMVVLCDEFTPGFRLVNKALSGTLPVIAAVGAVNFTLAPKSFCQETLSSQLCSLFNGQAWCQGGREVEISHREQQQIYVKNNRLSKALQGLSSSTEG